MNLEQLNIAIRPRRDWEAVDLGLLMARKWWWQMQRVWLLVTLPWLLASWIVPLDYLWLLSLTGWWLKPLFERPLLMILSQGVFGATPSTSEALRAFPRLAARQWLLSLTWRRFSFSRAMDLPVVQLEGLHGSERQARLTVLHRDDSNPAAWLTIIGIHVESFIALACFALFALFIPQEMSFEIWSAEFWMHSRPGAMLTILFAYIGMAMVAPLYVACGFSLYLNRRVKLEGWDLEIAFKRMAQKRGFISLALLVAIGTFAVPSLAPDAQAEPAAASDAPMGLEAERQAIAEQIVAIKNGPDFHRIQQQRVLQLNEPEPSEPPTFEWLSQLLRAFGALLNHLAAVAEILLWAAVLALLLLVVLKYRSWLQRFEGVTLRRKRTYRPQTLFGMAVTEDSLPDDVGGTALALWQSGEHRPALALLYRASLTQLLQRGVPLKDGSTEQECLWLTQQLQRDLALPAASLDYFAQLTGTWRRLAYGHQKPQDEQARALCQHWQSSWSTPNGESQHD